MQQSMKIQKGKTAIVIVKVDTLIVMICIQHNKLWSTNEKKYLFR